MDILPNSDGDSSGGGGMVGDGGGKRGRLWGGGRRPVVVVNVSVQHGINDWLYLTPHLR